MKKLLLIFLLCFPIIILSSCKDPKQEKCDSESTIEYFLEYWKPEKNSLGVNYRFDFNYNTKILKDKDYLTYDVIKDIEYEEYHLSHKHDHIPNEDINLIYGSGILIEQNFILMSDLERVCVFEPLMTQVIRFSFHSPSDQ